MLALTAGCGGGGNGDEAAQTQAEPEVVSAEERREDLIRAEIDGFAEKDVGDYCYLGRKTEFIKYSREYQTHTLPVNELECRRTPSCIGRDGRPLGGGPDSVPTPTPEPPAPKSSPRHPLPPGIGCVRFTAESERARARVDRRRARENRAAVRRAEQFRKEQKERIARGEFREGDPCPPGGPPPGFTCVPDPLP